MRNRAALLETLERGLIDMTGSSSNFKITGGRMIPGDPYAEGDPAIYVNRADKSTLYQDLVEKRVESALLKAPYPKALFQFDKTLGQVVTALVFGDADVYVGNAIASNYLINISCFNCVRLDSLLNMPADGFAFTLKDGRLHVHIAVEDTWPGISYEDRQRLFQPFIQFSHDWFSRADTGLELTLCRSLCEVMGGGLVVRSAIGKGTGADVDFYPAIMPPLLKVVPQPVETGRAERPVLKVLVVDDQPVNRHLLCEQFGFLGHAVDEAENGEEGLKLWREKNFDVVLSDCNMPIMNGYDMSRAIRKDEAECGGRRCIIIGYTANALSEEKIKCLSTGMDDCLFKPVSLTSLSKMLQAISTSSSLLPVSPVGVHERPASIAVEERLRDLTGGDERAMEALVREAYNTYTKDLADLKSVIGESDTPVLSDLAHRIRGAARIVSAASVIGACNILEEACRADVVKPAEVAIKASVLLAELEALVLVVKGLNFRADLN